jgi:hypothetical protein
MMNFNEHMHCLRGTHLKTQGVRWVTSTAWARLTVPVRHGQVHRSRQAA